MIPRTLEEHKKAEKEDCVVIRAGETRGAHTTAEISAADSATIIPTNLMEWEDKPETAGTGTLSVSLSPFEIATFNVRGCSPL